MGRYIKRYGRIGMSLGPSEERGFALWVGYDLVGVDGDHSAEGLVAVDDWTPEQLAERGVIGFTRVEPDDGEQYKRLGITQKRKEK
jgi:hypothetical protein